MVLYNYLEQHFQAEYKLRFGKGSKKDDFYTKLNGMVDIQMLPKNEKKRYLTFLDQEKYPPIIALYELKQINNDDDFEGRLDQIEQQLTVQY